MAMIADPVYASSVPNITNLRKQLGYDYRLRWKELYDSASSFRQEFKSRNGLKGTALVNWRSQDHQDALADMTDVYLEVKGNGSLYWPNDDNNTLKYSTDSKIIKLKMQQLFWRLNFHNDKYERRKRKRQTERPSIEQVPPVGQARVEFMYRVVCLYPQRQSFSWRPEGSFRANTLAKLAEELPTDLKWRYLHFRLVAPNTHAELSVHRDREDRFEALKRYFARFIGDCIEDTPSGETVFVEIDIEMSENAISLRKWWTKEEIIGFDW